MANFDCSANSEKHNYKQTAKSYHRTKIDYMLSTASAVDNI